jgi:MurNAc alpha-1-phosphate uridylyltransferase
MGDFVLRKGRLFAQEGERYTFSGIGYYSPIFFEDIEYGKRALAPLLRGAMESGNVSGELFGGEWHDIGTPERLAMINQTLGK